MGGAMGKQPNRGDGLASARGRRASGAAFGPILRLLAFSAVGCTAASAAIWMYPQAVAPGAAMPAAGEAPRAAPARKPSPEPVRASPNQSPVVQVAAVQGGPTRSLTGALPPAAPGGAAPTRSLLPAGAETGARPAPAAVPASLPPAMPAQLDKTVTAFAGPAQPDTGTAPTQADAAASAPPLTAASKVPTDCMPAEFKSLVRDLEARFGRVTLVSTTILNTNNHGKGSARHKLHTDCKAVDFKVAGDVKAVTQFLRSRPEVLGVNAFANNGVIHIDFNDRRRAAARN